MSAAPKPLAPQRESTVPLTVPARRRELPVAYWPPAESETCVPSAGLSLLGPFTLSVGAATRAVASAGGAPVAGVWARAVDAKTRSGPKERRPDKAALRMTAQSHIQREGSSRTRLAGPRISLAGEGRVKASSQWLRRS